MATANEVKVVLSAQDRNFKVGMQSARNELRGLQTAAHAASAAMRFLLPVAGVAAVANLTKNAIDAADALKDLKQITGLSIPTLNGLSLAAESFGTDLEGVAKGVAQFARFVDAAKEPTSAQGRLLAQLGIQTKDPQQALLQIADIFKRMPDGLAKTNLAMELFGKSGTSMIPMLNAGSRELQEWIDRGNKLAPGMEEMADDADALNDNLLVLRKNVSGLGAKMASETVRGLGEVTEAMVTAADEAGILTALLVGTGGLFKLVFDPDDAMKSLSRLNNDLVGLREQLARAEGGFLTDSNAAARLKKRIAEIEAEIAGRKRLADQKDKDAKADKLREAEAERHTETLTKIKNAELADIKAAMDAQQKVVQSATAAINKAESERVSLAEKNKKRLEELSAPTTQANAPDLNAQDETTRYWNRVKARADLLQTIATARNALAKGDFETAIQKGDAAAEQILALKDASADAISVLAAQQKEIAGIQDQAAAGKASAAKENLGAEQDKLEGLQELLRTMQNIPVGIDMPSAMEALMGVSETFQSYLDAHPIKGRIEFSSAAGGDTPGFAGGGYVSGPGGPRSDSIMARLSNREFVMNADATQHYGVGFMNMINRLQLPKFADGGPVKSGSGSTINLTLPGNLGTYQMQAEESVAVALQKTVSRAALMRGRRR